MTKRVILAVIFCGALQIQASNATRMIHRINAAIDRMSDSKNNALRILNETKSMAYQTGDKLVELEEQFSENAKTLERITSINYLIPSIMAALSCALAIGGIFIFGRYLANQHEQPEQPVEPAPLNLQIIIESSQWHSQFELQPL